MKNEFFNPDECPFEVLGFYEDLTDADTREYYGSRRIESPDRPVGSPGMCEHIITENLVLQRGHRQNTLKASSKRPKRVVGVINILCGRTKEK
jgi:hypothetical protein